MTTRISIWTVVLCKQGAAYLAIPFTTREKAQAHYERWLEEFSNDDVQIIFSWLEV